MTCLVNQQCRRPTSKGSTYSFRKPSGATTEAQKARDITIRLAVGNPERRGLIRPVAFANFEQLLHRRVSILLSLEKKDALLRNASILGGGNSYRHGRGHRHENLGLCRFERVGHLFDIVCRRCPRNNTTWRISIILNVLESYLPARTVPNMATGYQIVFGLNKATVWPG